MPALLLLLLLPVIVLALMPLILVQRYRAGTALSTACFLLAASVSTFWAPGALVSALMGLAAGAVLGAIGVTITRWEPDLRSLHYTPSRTLVLMITLVVSARVLYGFWRSFTVVRDGVYGTPVIAAFGIAQSLAAGGLVLGYYLAYSVGLWWHVRRWQRRALRVL